MKTEPEHYMERALALARIAESQGEVPIGAVLVYQDEIIGEGFNQVIVSHDPTAHAEIVALRQAGLHLQNYRLTGSTLYVTLEPCAMCAGALIHARVERVVFAAADPKSSAQTVFNSPLSQKLNHEVQCEGGLLAEPCVTLLKNFFVRKR